jgi:hypothetical protein
LCLFRRVAFTAIIIVRVVCGVLIPDDLVTARLFATLLTLSNDTVKIVHFLAVLRRARFITICDIPFYWLFLGVRDTSR